jgi:hypothetical protein
LLLYAIEVGLGTAYMLNFLAGRPIRKLTHFLDLDAEANLPTWYSSTQLCLVAILFGAVAYRGADSSRRGRVLTGLVAAAFLLLSMDETASIHEWLGKLSDALLAGGTRKGTMFARTGIWPFVIGVPSVAAFLWLLAAMRRHIAHAPGAFGRLLGGALLLFGCALIPEVFVNFVPAESTRVIEVLIEELGEMVGTTTIAWGAYTLLLATPLAAQRRPTPRP